MIASIYNTTNPAGFDLKIQDVQVQLACLNCIEAIFGVARVQLDLQDDSETEDTYLIPDMGKKGTTKHERWYPQGRKGNSDIDLTIDDTYSSKIFFLVKDPISTSPAQDKWDWAGGNNEIKQPFSLLLHCNLSKIINANLQISNYEQIKLSVLYALSQCPKIIVNSLSENIESFWKEFSMTEAISGFGRHPFYCLRIEADAYYYAFPNNGSNIDYDPSINFNRSLLNTITPNSDAGYANVN